PGSVAPAHSQNDENKIQYEIQRRLDAGEKPNKLIDEKSPYLLQHAFNPVDWYPWGEEAFSLAEREDKPIFLSIGYSTCHWCHVMADESFESDEVAALLNQHFVSIKVDREERPDIDQMYMLATQAMTGSGGWPMSVFLLPDGSPFYAGTYFPPESAYNRPGFKELLTAINKAWTEKRDDIERAAGQMVASLERAAGYSSELLNDKVVRQGYSILEENYDGAEGGFGTSPKFPRPVVLSFLFDYFVSTGESKAKQMALHTLDKMAAGGMNDQLGGGFHRYSVDNHWFVPHFEKMLYDQAQLANSYLDAYQITRDESYSQTAQQIIAYLLRDMRDPNGGFYSAEDADSDNPYAMGEHGEGAFYLWTQEEIVRILGAEAAKIFNYSYGVMEHGNVEQDPAAEFTGRNILYRRYDIDQSSAALGLDRELVEKSIDSSKAILLKTRELRQRPHLDDKVITGWNGQTIGALARGSMVLQDPQLLEEAVQTASFVKQHLYDKGAQTLHRRYRNGEAGLPGQLHDYTYMAAGLLELYQASHDQKWLKWAIELTQKQMELFWNEDGGYFFDSVDDPTLKVRMRAEYDGAEPAGNSVAALNLLRLGQLRNNTQWLEKTRRLIESFSDTINRYPPALPLMLTAWKRLSSKPTQVVIAGTRDGQDTRTLLEVVQKNFDPARLVLLADGEENQAYLAEKLVFLESVKAIDGVATAYVCTDFVCQIPVTDPQSLQRQLGGEQVKMKLVR
ncbi:MAG: thioredoxin domain-containing protein, partial [Desulfocapsaceae bacterium]